MSKYITCDGSKHVSLEKKSGIQMDSVKHTFVESINK